MRNCKLGPRRLEAELARIERYRQSWAARFDAPVTAIEGLQRKEKRHGRQRTA